MVKRISCIEVKSVPLGRGKTELTIRSRNAMPHEFDELNAANYWSNLTDRIINRIEYGERKSDSELAGQILDFLA